MRFTRLAACALGGVALASCAVTSAGGGENSPVPAGPAAAVAPTCPVGFPTVEQTLVWRARVYAARAQSDPVKRREALAALVAESLAGTGITLNVAATSSADEIVAEDFKPMPAVNFDMNLNQKQSMKFTAETTTRSLANNAGYYFTKNQVPYLVLGPRSIDARGPSFIREFTEHETFHGQHHVGDPRPLAERELEAWTKGFLDYFHIHYPWRMAWGPFIDYYTQSSTAAQQIALDKLMAYYNTPPVGVVGAHCADEVKAEFRGWVEQRLKDDRTRSKKLIRQLQARLNLPTPVATGPLAAWVRYWVGAGDLTGDGKAEVFRWDTKDMMLTLYDYSTGQAKQIASQLFEQAPTSYQVADLDRDGRNELILGEGLSGYNTKEGDQTDVRLHIYKPLDASGWTPQEIFRVESERPEVTGMQVVNVDDDPDLEIVFSYFESKYFVDFQVADRTGPDTWKVTKLGRFRMGTDMAIGDVMTNGRELMVVARPYGDETQENRRLNTPPMGDAFVVNGATREQLPVHRGVSAVAVGDVNGDGKKDIVVGDGWHSDYGKIARARLAVIRRDGNKWAYELIEDVPEEMRITHIELVDLDQDGKDEIVAQGDGRVAFKMTPVRIYKRTPAGWRKTLASDSAQGFAIADVNGDGRKEIMIAAPETTLRTLNLAAAKWSSDLGPAVQTFLNNPKELIGKTASELVAEEWVGGAPVTLAALRGKVVLLDYWATWCAPCISAFPELKRLQSEYGKEGFVIVGVTNHSQQVSADVRKMVADKKLTWPTAIDPGSRMHMNFGVQNLPHQTIIDQNGTIHSYYVGGGSTIDAIERDIRKLLRK